MNFKSSFLYIAKAVVFGLVMAAIFLTVTAYLNGGNFSSGFNNSTHRNDGLSFSTAVRRAAPAVVNIYSISIDKSRPINSGSLQELGSGVIMSKDGYIITNYHVVQQADEIIVALQDGRRFTSEVVGSDSETDLAVLKIEGDNLPLIPINLNHPALVGDVVLAIGNPYNIGQTITQGIISATGRSGLSSGYLDFLQTDAAINAGNSGGALVDTNGDLIGINTAAFTVNKQDGNNGISGISFAIPIKLAHSIMGKLIKNGRVIRGAIGFTGEAITPVIAQILNLPDLKGVAVTAIEPNGPAAKAQLKPRDVIIKYNNEIIPGTNLLMDRVAETKPGKQATLTILRNGKQQQLHVIVGEKKAAK
ncbi:outer membrane-stress sensor serine endopeptidase DegS [Shewanella intestini]|uniref:Outer membrane-stress sensor serine endopeptidase DegS n=1 Tax=Shewanella intestini TaxID=2017544 RepID=A0ABS5I0T7_9GAMM|nr:MULTISPECIES: outer membrane-stress sensor serine endopeptidase DegS [Shewanella]MBR9727636.1 outer membrane-stress sensor serine endopeptidase DegS [Shewanella intestini]MRG35214.1 outer membrane-stress sensor serine endopeptidase DegS [Shewanella sp. XMDDZSB0408]